MKMYGENFGKLQNFHDNFRFIAHDTGKIRIRTRVITRFIMGV